MRSASKKPPAGLRGGIVRAEAELSTMLNTISSFQGAVQHADEKVRTVVAIQAMITAMVTAQLALLGPPRLISAPHFAILFCFVVAYLYSSFHLVQAVRPRTGAPPGGNRFAFPSVATGKSAAVSRSVRDQCDEARELTRLLAALAMRKHRHVRFALTGIWVLFLSGLGLPLMTMLS